MRRAGVVGVRDTQPQDDVRPAHVGKNEPPQRGTGRQDLDGGALNGSTEAPP